MPYIESSAPESDPWHCKTKYDVTQVVRLRCHPRSSLASDAFCRTSPAPVDRKGIGKNQGIAPIGVSVFRSYILTMAYAFQFIVVLAFVGIGTYYGQDGMAMGFIGLVVGYCLSIWIPNTYWWAIGNPRRLRAIQDYRRKDLRPPGVSGSEPGSFTEGSDSIRPRDEIGKRP